MLVIEYKPFYLEEARKMLNLGRVDHICGPFVMSRTDIIYCKRKLQHLFKMRFKFNMFACLLLELAVS